MGRDPLLDDPYYPNWLKRQTITTVWDGFLLTHFIENKDSNNYKRQLINMAIKSGYGGTQPYSIDFSPTF